MPCSHCRAADSSAPTVAEINETLRKCDPETHARYELSESAVRLRIEQPLVDTIVGLASELDVCQARANSLAQQCAELKASLNAERNRAELANERARAAEVAQRKAERELANERSRFYFPSSTVGASFASAMPPTWQRSPLDEAMLGTWPTQMELERARALTSQLHQQFAADRAKIAQLTQEAERTRKILAEVQQASAAQSAQRREIEATASAVRAAMARPAVPPKS